MEAEQSAEPENPETDGTGVKESDPAISGQIRLYDSEGTFIGVYAYRKEKRWYQPVKIFAGGQ